MSDLNGVVKLRKDTRKDARGPALGAGKKADPWHSRPEVVSPVMTKAEVATYFGKCPRTVERLVEAGVLRPRYLGRLKRPLFDRAEVEAAWRQAPQERPE